MKQILNISFLLLLSSLLHAGEVNQNGDFQIWPALRIKKEINPKTQIFLEGEMRYGDNASTLYFYYIQARMSFLPNKHFSISPAYRQIFDRSHSSSNWTPLYEPLINFTFLYPFKGWELQDRNRISYIFHPAGDSAWIYRNRLLFKHPMHWKRGRVTPYFFDEIFVKGTDGFFQNRVAIGITFTPHKISKTGVFYIFRSLKAEHKWKHNNILYLELEFSF